MHIGVGTLISDCMIKDSETILICWTFIQGVHERTQYYNSGLKLINCLISLIYIYIIFV